MNQVDKITNDLSVSLKAGDKLRVSILRLIISEINNAKIQKGEQLTEEEVIAQINKEAKRHLESIEAYKKGNREELVQKEEKELLILKEYLPQPLTEQELNSLIDEATNALGVSNIKDMGKVIGHVMAKAGTGADGKQVAQIVQQKLTS